MDNTKYGDDPVEINSDDVLKACAVGLGSMGIVYSITYRCVPMYNLEEIRKVEHVTWLSSKEFEVPPKFAQMYNNPDDGPYFSFFVTESIPIEKRVRHYGTRLTFLVVWSFLSAVRSSCYYRTLQHSFVFN